VASYSAPQPTPPSSHADEEYYAPACPPAPRCARLSGLRGVLRLRAVHALRPGRSPLSVSSLRVNPRLSVHVSVTLSCLARIPSRARSRPTHPTPTISISMRVNLIPHSWPDELPYLIGIVKRRGSDYPLQSAACRARASCWALRWLAGEAAARRALGLGSCHCCPSLALAMRRRLLGASESHPHAA
jgi:hypothetical protein